MDSEVNFALILSSIISIISVVTAAATSIYQQYNQRMTKSMGMYFEAKLKAYAEFHRLSQKLDINTKPTDSEINEVIAAAKIATILSPLPIAEIIEDFSFFLLLVNCDDAPDCINMQNAKKDYYTALNAAQNAMREELLQYDLPNKKHIKKLRCLRKKLKKDELIL